MNLLLRGVGGMRGRELGMDMHKLLCLKQVNSKVYCIAHGTLLNVMCQSEWKCTLGENRYTNYMTESLAVSPGTITLLTGDTPI